MDKKLAKQQTKLANIPGLNEPTQIPQAIASYPVDAFYAKGGMSYLYLATNPTTKKPIIIKVLPQSYITFPEMTKRFLKEAKIIAQTNHPNIVQLIDQGTWKGGLYIAMEFIRGISLKKIIQQNTFSLEKSLQILLQIASAISHLHAHGIIHRDLKPENILIDEEGSAKVIDFGIARMHDEKIDLEKLEGTALYMAPEQREKKAIDPRADIYSLGVIAYELIKGKPAYGMVQIASLSPSLRPLLAKALAIDPNERYKDIVDFIHAIKRYLDSDLSQTKDDVNRMNESFDKAQLQICNFPEESQFFETATSAKNQMQSTFFDYRQINGQVIIAMFSSMSDSLNQAIFTAHLAGLYKAYIQEVSKIDLRYLIEKLDGFARELKQIYSVSLCHIHPDRSEVNLCSMGPSLVYKEFDQIQSAQSALKPLGEEDLANLRIQSTGLWEEQTLQFVHFSFFPEEKIEKKLHELIQNSQTIAFTNRPESVSEALFDLGAWNQNKPFVFFIRKTL